MANEIMTVKAELSAEGGNFYTSLKGETREDKKRLFNAMNSPDANVSDYINKSINLKDVYVEMVEMPDEKTGEIVNAPRIVLFDDKGKSYQAISKGMMMALKAAFIVYGEPHTWSEPLPITIKQVSVKNGRSMLTFDVD
jgi:hypothetical protein